jgi:hypothetical protein
MMATLFFGVDGPTLDLRQDLNIADADAPRILAYLMASSYGTVTENVQSEVPDAGWSPSEDETEADRPMIAMQSWVTRPATPEETASNYARAILASLLDQTVAWEKAQAAAAAAGAIAPITPVT